MADQLGLEQEGPWETEVIPDQDYLFYRVALGGLRLNRLPHPNVFKENRGAMSVDWNKYSTSEETRARQGAPERFGVLKLPVAGVRAINSLSVEHQPIYEPDKGSAFVNRAHSGVVGIEMPSGINEIGYKERVRLDLLKLVEDRWEIHPEAPIPFVN